MSTGDQTAAATRRAATCDFDHHGRDAAERPFEVYARLRSECPVAYTDAWGGFWVVSRYEDVLRVALDDDTFRSRDGVALPMIGQARPLLPIETDPPEFHRYRRLLNPKFSPGAARRMEGEIRSITNDLIDQFIGRGNVDFVHELSMPLPARTTLRLLGIDDRRWQWFLHRIHIGIHEAADDLNRSMEHLFEVYTALAETLDRRQQEGLSGDDLISYLGRAVQDGEIAEEDVLDICLLTLFGGLDTTASAISLALYHLASMPEARARMLADPAAMHDALEEFLRFEAPVQGLARTVAREVTVGGQRMMPGDKVWVLWGSANRDSAEFPDPDEVCLDRKINRHVTFGVGIHRCLGSNLARVMLRVAVTEVLRRIPDYTIKPGFEPKHFPDSSVVYAMLSLPASFPAS